MPLAPQKTSPGLYFRSQPVMARSQRIDVQKLCVPSWPHAIQSTKHPHCLVRAFPRDWTKSQFLVLAARFGPPETPALLRSKPQVCCLSKTSLFFFHSLSSLCAEKRTVLEHLGLPLVFILEQLFTSPGYPWCEKSERELITKCKCLNACTVSHTCAG